MKKIEIFINNDTPMLANLNNKIKNYYKKENFKVLLILKT